MAATAPMTPFMPVTEMICTPHSSATLTASSVVYMTDLQDQPNSRSASGTSRPWNTVTTASSE